MDGDEAMPVAARRGLRSRQIAGVFLLGCLLRLRQFLIRISGPGRATAVRIVSDDDAAGSSLAPEQATPAHRLSRSELLVRVRANSASMVCPAPSPTSSMPTSGRQRM